MLSHTVSKQLIDKVLLEDRAKRGLVVIELYSKIPHITSDSKSQWLFVLPSKIVSGSLEQCWPYVSLQDPMLLPPIQRIAAYIEKKNGFGYNSVPMTLQAVGERLKIDNSKEYHSDESTDIGISVSSLEFQYSGKNAFHLGPITFDFKKGRTTAILGENGVGKTTLLRCLGNLNSKWLGTLLINGKKRSQTEPLHQWARTIIYCFQNPDDQLFLPTVFDELRESAQRIQDKSFPIEERVHQIADALSLG